MQVLDAETLFADIGCSIVAWIQNVSSAFNYCIKVTTKAVKLNVSIGCRHIASNGCSIMTCIQSVYSACNKCKQATMDAGLYTASMFTNPTL